MRLADVFGMPHVSVCQMADTTHIYMCACGAALAWSAIAGRYGWLLDARPEIRIEKSE